MTATTKPVYRWVDCVGGSCLRSESNGFPVAEVYRDCVDEWNWRKIGDRESHTSFVTIAVAKAACERAMGITTQAVQEDQPAALPFCWDHIKDNLFALNGTSGSRLAIVNYDGAWNHWFWNPMGDPEGLPYNRAFKTEGEAKSSCEQFFYAKAKAVQDDQPPVIVPPDGLADALDAHAAKVTEEDAEARHASAMAEKPEGKCDIRKAAKILSIHLGIEVHPTALWQSLELASVEA